MVRYRVLPYKQGSRSAKALATALGGKVLRLQGSTFKPKPGDVLVNWGNSQPMSVSAPNLLAYGEECSWSDYYNTPVTIGHASNKLSFFQSMESNEPGLTPKFWTDKKDIKDEDFPVVCRTVLSGHSGDGIVIANHKDDLVDCSLYVKYVKKKDEYRVHVGKTINQNGDIIYTIIAVQRKAKRNGAQNVNWQVRNLANGFVFVRNDVNPPESVLDVARQAIFATGLDFGAVDVIFNEAEGRAYVLEINTAPGLEGQTITDYANFFRGVVW